MLPLKVALLSALMNTESRFSEILRTRNLLISLEPTYGNSVENMVFLMFMAIERHIKHFMMAFMICFHDGFGE